MVMRNQCDGGGPADWWHDLPPRVRTRFAGPPARPAARPPADHAAVEPHPPAGPGLLADLARMTVAGLAVWAAMVLFLLVSLAFLSGGPLPVPGR